MIILKLTTNGLDLIKLETSLVTSDNKKSVSLEVTFDDSWTGYGKSATFKSSSSDKIYEVPLTDNACVVPWEVLESVGIMSIGVRGVKDDGSVVASDLVDYKIAQGAKTGDGTSEDPTPTVYEQLLSNYSSVDQKITKEIQDRKDVIAKEIQDRANAIATEKSERMTEVDVERKRIDNFVKLPSGSTSGDAELIDIRIGADGNTYNSAGTAMRAQINNLKEDLATLKTTQDNVVDVEKTAFFDVQLLSANRFNWEEPPYIDNMLFTGSGEKTAENTGYYISQFMRIDGGKTYYQNLNSPICLYDNAHKYIRTVKYNESPFVADENAKYVRCSVQRSAKASKYISEMKQIGTQAGYVTPFTGDKIVVNDKRLEKALSSSKEEIIKTVYGDNRFDVTEPHFEDEKIIQYGNIIDRTGYFISHLMKIKPKTTYYKNEAGDGIFYDKKMNIVGLSNNEGLTFTSPDNAFYYRCSLTNGIASKFYVSTVNKISSFEDTYELEQPAKSAVEKVVKDLKGTGEAVIEKRISKISESLNGTLPIEKAIVTFIDDDGAKVINTIVLPYLKETKTKLGVAVITGAIGSTDYYMTEDELLECHKSGYVETLSHCHNQYTALTSLSEDELHYQYATSKEWLESHGFEAESFVYPQNTTNKLVRKVARKYYNYCFTGISFNSEKYLDHSLINRIAFGSFESYNPEISGISDKDSLDYYKACVDMAIENGQWLVFNTHFGIETSHTTNAQLTLFKNLVDYIKSKGIEIVFPSEGFALKRNIISFGDKDETHLFLGNNDFDSRNIIGSRITPIGDKTNQTPITEYKSGIISISTIDYAHGHGGKFPAEQGILETYRDASWLGYSYQKFTELKTCKQYMRFWDADVTNSWLSWVSIN